jgi:dCMP deaminase
MRPEHDTYFLDICRAVAKRSTCLRRQVGAVLVDQDHRILSTGYNGGPCGLLNCCDLHTCLRQDQVSGAGLQECVAVHAEQNALLQCPDTRLIHTIYCTHEPCQWCARLLLNTRCQRVVFVEGYPNSGVDLWLKKFTDASTWSRG